jgi:hypothetical protein
MGLLIPEANLPSQITLSNVYVSFSEENILVTSNGSDGGWRVISNYRIFSDQTKSNGTNIRIPIEVVSIDIIQGVYTILYGELKRLYPNSEDIL